MTGKNKYNHLLPLEEGSDDDDFGDSKPLVDEEQRPEIKKNNGTETRINGTTAYPFTEYTRPRKNRCFTATACVSAFGFCLLGLLVGYIAGFFTPSGVITFLEKQPEHPRVHKRSAPWRVKLSDYGTESCIRLVDVDGDGVSDVIMGIALGKDVSQMVTESSMEEFCHRIGMKVPCAGGIVALRGYDGKLLWKVDSYSEIFALNCHSIDVNKDGVDDCIATGRLASIQAINPRTGEVLWETPSKYINRGWNIYAPAILPDVDYDGVNDIVISHGGDPTIASSVHTRNAGRIVIISGATGLPIGRHLDMPEDKETYFSPVIHRRKDGSVYVLYGSGGETVPGLFMAISVPDLYRYAMHLPKNVRVANTNGSYGDWGEYKADPDGVIQIYRSKEKGVMVPPVLVDINKDGVSDILMSSFDGMLILYDGETLEEMWRVQFEERESYSSAAPGYFNDDGVLDFMVHWSYGAWPYYNSTDVVILDGKDGSIIWNLTSSRYDVSSDLVARTNEFNRDVFFYRVQGRLSRDPLHTGAYHGATGIQRIVDTRSIIDGSAEFQDTILDETNRLQEGVMLPESHFRSRRETSKDYIECESDQSAYLTELFAMDRTNMKNPLKIWEKGSEKYFYKLTASDRVLVKEAMAKYGITSNLTENEVPWSRGKRSVIPGHGQKRQEPGPFCIYTQPDERTTGAIGDVDGDGQLDVIVNLITVGILRDEHARFVKMKFDTEIFKINLEDAFSNPMHTPINATTHDKLKTYIAEPEMTSLHFLPDNQQPWMGYMGTDGHSRFS